MPRTRQAIRNWAGRLSGMVLLTALLVLVAWGLGIERLVRPVPNGAAMVPATALALIAVAGAQLLLHGTLRRSPHAARALAVGAAIFCAVRIGLTVEAYLAAPPGSEDRMALASSMGILAAAVGTFSASLRGRAAEITTTAIGATGLLFAMTALATFFLDHDAYATTLIFIGMAPHSAACIGLLFMAVLLSRPDLGLVRAAFGDGTGSRVARRFFPLALLGPLLLAELAISVTRSGLLNSSIWFNALAAGIALLSFVTVLRVAMYRNAEAIQAQREQTRLRTALDGLDAAVFLFNADRRLMMVNRGAERISSDADSLQDWLFESRFHTLGERRILRPEDNPVRALLRGDRTEDVFVGWFDPQRQERALRFCLRRHPGSELLILSVLDETQGWALRENLSRTERLDAVGQMAGGIAHEMANIFGMIRLGTDTALLTEDPAVMRKHLALIQTACGRGADLTERLLSLTRDRPQEAEIVDLRELLADFETVARATLPAELPFRAVLPKAGELLVRVVPTDLQAALLNLVFNARNAIVESDMTGGRIRLVVTKGDQVRLAVEDNGPGMPAWILARAAEPFYTTRLARGGTGLGLAMVDNFVRRSNGSMSVRSSPGEGTTVALALPAAGASTMAAEPARQETRDLAGRRVLVVENDPLFGNILSDLLMLQGADVAKALTAEDALRIVQSDPSFDILVTDINLPGAMGGYALAERLSRAQSPVPVVYLADYADTPSDDGRSVPGLLVRKPISATAIINAIDLSLQT